MKNFLVVVLSIISVTVCSSSKTPFTLEQYITKCGFDEDGHVCFDVNLQIKNNTSKDVQARFLFYVYFDTLTTSKTNDRPNIEETKNFTIEKGKEPINISMRCIALLQKNMPDTVFLYLGYYPVTGKEKGPFGEQFKYGDYVVFFRRIPIKVVKPSEFIKFDITNKGYEKQLGSGFYNIAKYGRIDFKVENISNEPIKNLIVKADWYKYGTKEIYDTEEYYIISGVSDSPLKPGYSKIDYITAPYGKSSGMKYRVDIYLSFDRNKWELIKEGIIVGL